MQIVKQQAALMVKYQRQLDATDARLTKSQKLLRRIVDNQPVRNSPKGACLPVCVLVHLLP